MVLFNNSKTLNNFLAATSLGVSIPAPVINMISGRSISYLRAEIGIANSNLTN